MSTVQTFESFKISSGRLADLSLYRFPTCIHGWDEATEMPLKLTGQSTFIGCVYKGPVEVVTNSNTLTLITGQYFAIADAVSVKGGQGIIIEAMNYRGLDQFGGPIETDGRLQYVSGCTDTLLISADRLGNPCLNALFFPPSIDQIPHTHPSIRIGIVVTGSGKCVTETEVIELKPGMVFIIHEDGKHSFSTSPDEGMTVVAYHPDSDFGPQDDDHPMINRTIVDGVSAAQIKSIQSRSGNR